MSAIFNWVYYLTITPFSWFFKVTGLVNKKANLLIVGLDNAGKTTLLGLMSSDRVMCHEPTRHPNMEELSVGNIRFKAHDLGGHAAARRLWRSYYHNTDCVLFMVDSSDHYRMVECRNELANLLMGCEGTPVLVLGNKIDVTGSCNELQLRQYLGIIDSNPDVGVFMCSVVKRAGIQKAFEWLATKL